MPETLVGGRVGLVIRSLLLIDRVRVGWIVHGMDPNYSNQRINRYSSTRTTVIQRQ